MKYIISILFSIMVLTSMAQTDSLKTDSLICYTPKEIQNLGENIDSLETTISLQDSLITALEYELFQSNSLNRSYETLSMYDKQHNDLLVGRIELYQKQQQRSDKWYNSKPFSFAMGVATIIVSSIVVKNAVGGN